MFYVAGRTLYTIPFDLSPSPFSLSLSRPLLHRYRISTGCIALSIDCIEKCDIAALTPDAVYRLCVVRKSTCDVWWPMSQSISLLLLISMRCNHEIRIRAEEMQSIFALPSYWPSIQRCEAISLMAEWADWLCCCYCKHMAFLECIQRHFSGLWRMEECAEVHFPCNN